MDGSAFRWRKRIYPTVVLCILYVGLGGLCRTLAQTQQPSPCDPPPNLGVEVCPHGIPLAPGSFHQTPLSDGNTSLFYPDPVTGPETNTLYGQFGTDELHDPSAQAHRAVGIAKAQAVTPIVGPAGETAAIVVLFIGFSNAEIEVCGGASDVWDSLYRDGLISVRVTGQACATQCPNPRNGNLSGSWNDAGDGIRQQSLLWQAYSPQSQGPRVGPHVYFFNGAKGGEFFANWDPFSNDNTCTTDKECDYERVATDLANNHFSESQVQVIVLHDADNYPYCDISGNHCRDGNPDHTPDAYRAEGYMGEIMRYLKSGLAGTPRYPNLKQVFVMSRNYGGYSQNAPTDSALGCLSPEPFAFEEAFGVQRLITAQIRQTNGITTPVDTYSGQVDYSAAPWFDWGPYLWASGAIPRQDGLTWCNNNPGTLCAGEIDFRNGDVPDDSLYGDLTHPRDQGTVKAAGRILRWFTDPTNAFASPWIAK